MTARTELIEALREAKEGSRELDARIYSAIHGRQFERMDDRDTNIIDPLSYCFWADGKRHTVWAVAAYSRSLDAAPTLVPEGWGWDLVNPTHVAPGKPRADVFCDDKLFTSGTAATPALALCIAALSSLPSDTEVKE